MEQDVRLETRQSGVFTDYRAVLSSVVRSPAAWLFLGLSLVATLYIALTGHAVDLLVCLEPLFFLLLIFLVIVPLTAGAPFAAPWEEFRFSSRSRLWWQVIIVVVFVLLLVFAVPLADLVHFSPLVSILNLLKLVVPLAGAFLLGARWRELGFGRGYRSWWSALVLSAPLIVALIILLAIRMITPRTVLLAFLNSFVLAGLGEEFTFRGVLMTRLTRLFRRDWGLVVSSLFFGIAHTLANIGYFNHASLLPAFALSIPFQALYGLVLAIVLQRTRNLVAGIALHTWTDTLNFALLPLIIHFLR